MKWIKANWLPIAVFGGMAVTMLAVSLMDGRFAHTWARAGYHVPWGFALAAVFSWTLAEVDRTTSWYAEWPVYWFGPAAIVLAIACLQEFGPGGDWHRNVGNRALQAKSIADICGWQFGALAQRWYEYRSCTAAQDARASYLIRKHGSGERPTVIDDFRSVPASGSSALVDLSQKESDYNRLDIRVSNMGMIQRTTLDRLTKIEQHLGLDKQ